MFGLHTGERWGVKHVGQLDTSPLGEHRTSKLTVTAETGPRVKREFQWNAAQTIVFPISRFGYLSSLNIEHLFLKKYAPTKTLWVWHMSVQTVMTLMTTPQILYEPKLRQSTDIYICWKDILPHLSMSTFNKSLYYSFIHSRFSFIYLTCWLVIQWLLIEVLLHIYHKHDNRYSWGCVYFCKMCGTETIYGGEASIIHVRDE